jgi:hypothetical protein
VLAGGHEDDLVGVEDGADPHRDGLLRHVFFAEEIARRVLACNFIEDDHARSRVPA